MTRTKRKKFSLNYSLIIFIFALLSGFFLIVNNNNKWHKYSHTNIILNTKPILIISFDHKKSSVAVISIPSNMYVDVAFGYGQYRIGKIFALDKQEGKNGSLIVNTIKSTLAIPIDGYLDLKQISLLADEKEYSDEYFMQGKNKLFLNPLYLTQGNLNLFDNLNIFAAAINVKANRLTFINLPKENVLIPDKLPDGSEVYNLDKSLNDRIMQNTFLEEELNDENFSVEILNSTSYLGLAEQGARLIENLGGKIINIGNEIGVNKRCKIYTKLSVISSYTVHRLQNLFDCEVNEESLKDSRADISVVLGEDYLKEFIKN